MEIPVYLELENDHSSTMFNNNNNDNKMAEEPLLIHPNGILRNVKGRGGKSCYDFKVLFYKLVI